MEIEQIKEVFSRLNSGDFDPFNGQAPYIPATEDGDYGIDHQIEIFIPGINDYLMIQFDWHYSEKSSEPEGEPKRNDSNSEVDGIRLFERNADSDFDEVTLDKELEQAIEDYVKNKITWG